MFDFHGRQLPADPEALREALEASVRRRIVLADRPAVSIDMDAWPRGRRLMVDVTGGHIEIPGDAESLRQARRELKPPAIVADRQAGPSFDAFEVRGNPVEVGPMQCQVQAQGRDVAFDFGYDEDGTPVMAPREGHGRVEASVPKQQLLAFMREQAIAAAAEKGVRLTEVSFDLQAPDRRTLALAGTLRGTRRLGFINASFGVDVQGRVEIDEELVGHMRQLELCGHGLVVEALLTLLRPKLNQIRQQPLPLRDVLGAMVPAALGLRDLAVEVGEDVTLRAEFGEG